MSQTEKAFVDYVLELLSPMQGVTAKRMFGGYGVFRDGLMFGLVADSMLYFKVDNTTVDSFEEKGLEAFSYNKKGKLCKLSYFQAPEDVLEERDEMQRWATAAFDVALRAAAKKKPKSK